MPIWTDHARTIVSFKRLRLDNTEVQAPVSRAEIGVLITEATALVVANGVAAAAPVVAVTANRRAANNAVYAATPVNVQNPSTVNQWLTELRTNAGGALPAPKFYKFGDWIIELAAGDGYYMETYGNSGGNTPFGTWDATKAGWSLGSTYADMKTRGNFDPIRAAAQIRDWLQARAVPGTTSGTANVALAMFVSEATRNYRTWMINLMCLDLLQASMLDWADLPDRFHPMARGGTYTRGTTGMAGGQKDATTSQFEINITMEWLEHIKLPRMWMWSDDAAVAPAAAADIVAAARGHVKSQLLTRLRSLGKM